MAVKEEASLEVKRPVSIRPEDTGYNPPLEKPIQPTKHQVPPPRKKKK